MSNKLVIDQGRLNKKAQGQPGEGPSFEQQFGILANAQITDKYPSLSTYQIAFQLLDKDDDNTRASGAVVYRLGKNVIQVPAFFNKGKINTGQMMYVPVTDTFLPLSDAWLSWIKNKDVSDIGQFIPADQLDHDGVDQNSARVKQFVDPVMKQASYSRRFQKAVNYAKASLSLNKSASVLNMALKLGKTASDKLLNMFDNTDFLNAALNFYKPQEIAGFAKTASEIFPEQRKAQVITVLDKKAMLLSKEQQQELWRDGWLIKKAEKMDWQEAPDKAVKVIRDSNINTQFGEIQKTCKVQLLTTEGDLQDATILAVNGSYEKNYCGDGYGGRQPGKFFNINTSWIAPAKNSIKGVATYIVKDGIAKEVKRPIGLLSSIQDTKITSGHSLSSLKRIPHRSILIFPNNTCMFLDGGFDKGDNGFFNDSQVLTTADDIKRPIISDVSMVLPEDTKVIFTENCFKADGTYAEKPVDDTWGHQPKYATPGALCYTLSKFMNKHYSKVKLTSDGQEITVTGEKSNTKDRLVQKEAAYHLVDAYDIQPQIAKMMVKEASAKGQVKPTTISYYLIKEALADDPKQWEDANIPMTQVHNNGPIVQNRDPEAFMLDDHTMQQVQTAAQNGIKQIFDMQTLKLLIQVADPQQQIMEIIPQFMTCLDKLCRLLFIYRSHVDDMQDKYGIVKLKALDQSMQNTLKDLSELTVFLKLRGLNNQTDKNADAGQLQTGRMLA